MLRRRRARLVTLAVLALATQLAGCKRHPRSSHRPGADGGRSAEAPEMLPRLLLKEGGELRIVDLTAGPSTDADAGVEHVRLSGSLVVLPDGRLAALSMGRLGVWRVKPRLEIARAIGDGIVGGFLLAASADGSAVLVEKSDGKDRKSIVLIRELPGGKAETIPLLTVRQDMGADISPDGRRAVVSAIPTTCTATWLGPCDIELTAFDLSLPGGAPRVLSPPGARAYKPRFVPNSDGARIAFQTTEKDVSDVCRANLNLCRHDLAVQDFSGSAPASILREAALGPYFARDGKTLAFMTYESCPNGVGCGKYSLWTARATPTGLIDPRRIVDGTVAQAGSASWSPDGRWLAYNDSSEARAVHVLRADGTGDRLVGSKGVVAGWLR